MKTLEGIYKAVCLEVDNQGEVVRCQVPQVFNDETVTCFDIAGGVFPLSGDEGWVIFESGFPDHPIWLAGADGISSPDVIPGAGVIDVNEGYGIDVSGPPQHPVVTGATLVAGQRVTINNGDPLHPVITANPQLPAGGAVGSLLAKNSTTDYDGTWVTPASLGFLPLSGGTMTGQIVMAAGGAGSEAIRFSRASDYIGFWNGGTREGYLQGHAGGMSLTADVGDLNLGSASGRVILPSSLNVGVPAAYGSAYGGLNWASGAYLIMSDGTNTFVSTPNGSGSVYIRGASNGAGIQIDASGNMNANLINTSGVNLSGGNSFYFASYGGGWYMQDATWCRQTNNKNVYTGGEIRAGSKYSFDNAGYVFTQSNDTDTGIYYDGDGNFRAIANGNTAMWFRPGIAALNYPGEIRVYSPDDGNHTLKYSNETPAYSGEGSNGPKLTGYATCWLHNLVGGYGGPYGWDAFLSPNGHLFISPGCGFYNFSSREFKDNVRTIDPSDALTQVLRWRPVEYDQDVYDNEVGALVARHSTGFISEEMVHVTPTAVNVTGSENARPGWANAMNYPSLTVQLAGAVQALSARLDALESAA